VSDYTEVFYHRYVAVCGDQISQALIQSHVRRFRRFWLPEPCSVTLNFDLHLILLLAEVLDELEDCWVVRVYCLLKGTVPRLNRVIGAG